MFAINQSEFFFHVSRLKTPHQFFVMNKKILIVTVAMLAASQANAIIIIPIPNFAFPPQLSAIRDAFEKSTDTKALATAGEDKVFGSKYWVWGQASGKMTQANADSQAISRCEVSLQNTKARTAGGQPLYNFGSKKCELYSFLNITVNLPDPTPAPIQIAASPSIPAAVTAPESAEIPNAAALTPVIPSPPTTSPGAQAALNSAPVPTTEQTPISRTNTAKGSEDIVQKMKNLDSLYKQGLISRDDFEKKKKQFLDAM